MKPGSGLVILVSALCAAPLLGKEKPPEPTVQPAVFQALLDCQAIADPAGRLACFDRTSTALAAAATSKSILVVDRATVDKTKRSLFGVAMPKAKLFGENDSEEIEQIETTITSTYFARDGMTVFVLADGARWKQTEGRNTFAKPGQPIIIKKGALGSFIAKINGQIGVRVIRLP
ncbi:MAG: hypothetical protein ABL912_12145 [Novosphingobium sp.]